jgi:uroporphyrinogen III methyltransferase/synthase
MKKHIKIGTRGSKLALWQANWVKSAIENSREDISAELVIIKTKGDKILDVPLAKVGGKGLFVKEIEESLLEGRVDIAVHSMKDMPAEIPQGLCIGAIPERENPKDVLISKSGKTFSELPRGARIGTSSLRRGAQLLHKRPDINILPLRGNLDTRLKKLETENLDAIVLAAAGVKRMNLEHRITEYLDEDIMVPAVGQGALCIEIRENDPKIGTLISRLNHQDTRFVVMGERAFLNRLEGGCQVPIAAHGKTQAGTFTLCGLVADIDGKTVFRESLSGPETESERIGVELAERLLEMGAGEILSRLSADGDSLQKISEKKSGKVYLVGAGPGDPGLITVKGLECIKRADVLIYDYLASPAFLAHAPEYTEKIYVGKKGGDHTLSQDGINALILEKAKSGLIVTRLKGGDPFIFGRGGEEAEILVNEGIPFEIVPGVTSAIAAPAYAGIPLTHREYTATLGFVTGHEDPTKAESGIHWESLAKGMGTLVFFMGVKNLPNITAQLLQHGMSPETPVALVRWGTTPRQVTVSGTLNTIVEQVRAAGLKAPAIIVVGEVVGLRDKLKWYENRPLMGKRVVVTRAREQASDLVNMLSDMGAECLECPTIEVAPPDDWALLDRATDTIAAYDWIVFTSVNGVKFFFERLFERGKDVRVLNHLRTAAIGPATAKRLLDFGLRSDIIPESYRAESVVDAFRNEAVEGKKILLPRAKEARPILPAELRKMGAEVDEITTYYTRQAGSAELLKDYLKDGSVDLITFTSSSTVKNFRSLLPPGDEALKTLMRDVVVASIGPITSDTAKELGFDVHIVAESFTIPGLCEAIRQYYEKV